MARTPTQGTLLKVSIAASYTTIPNRVTLGVPGINRNEIDVTDLDSTWEEIIVGIPRGQAFDITINWDPGNAVHAYLWTAITTGTLEAFKFTFADTGAADKAFSAYLTSDKLNDISVDGVVQKKITIKPTGAITLTP